MEKRFYKKHVKTDVYFMNQAFKEACKALKIQEIPIGAVIVKKEKIIGRGFNKCISLSDPTAHAEVVALRKAANKLRNYRLNNCFIYVTIEPCVMCVGALINARIKKIIFGAVDKKFGACRSVFRIPENEKLNHQIEVFGGTEKYLLKKCAGIMKDFFKKKRSGIQR
jgi:tRNA(adenine34) deaminase